jgi:hypothetical protein
MLEPLANSYANVICRGGKYSKFVVERCRGRDWEGGRERLDRSRRRSASIFEARVIQTAVPSRLTYLHRTRIDGGVPRSARARGIAGRIRCSRGRGHAGEKPGKRGWASRARGPHITCLGIKLPRARRRVAELASISEERISSRCRRSFLYALDCWRDEFPFICLCAAAFSSAFACSFVTGRNSNCGHCVFVRFDKLLAFRALGDYYSKRHSLPRSNSSVTLWPFRCLLITGVEFARGAYRFSIPFIELQRIMQRAVQNRPRVLYDFLFSQSANGPRS